MHTDGRQLLGTVAGGAALGALIAGVVAGLTYEPCTDCFVSGRNIQIYSGALFGAIAGAIAGLIVYLIWRVRRYGR